MIFNSYLFFAFFGILAIVFPFISQHRRWILLLLASLFFSAWASPKGLCFLLFSGLVTYFCTVLMEKQRSQAKLILFLDILINLGLLLATKYLNFFLGLFSDRHFSLFVPLGISFYTFMIIGYAIDVYRELIPAQHHFGKLLLFTCWFPQMLTGPISRYSEISEALWEPPAPEYARCREALVLFAWGLFKKCCVADGLSVYVDLIYGNYSAWHGLLAFSGAVAYAFFLYADFSGCIDMARGVSLYFGVRLPENFHLPYFADSVEDFWRRWHMTLSSWFRDYLFYPLMRTRLLSGMSKALRKKGYKKASRILPVSLALLVVWTFTGLWHGANGTFLLWGLYFGCLMILSNILNVVRKARKPSRHRWLSILLTFILVCFGYVFFNSDSIRAAWGMVHSIFSGSILDWQALKTLGIMFYKNTGGSVYFGITLVSSLLLLLHDVLEYSGVPVFSRIQKWNRPLRYLLSGLAILLLLFMLNRSHTDFTYMQF